MDSIISYSWTRNSVNYRALYLSGNSSVRGMVKYTLVPWGRYNSSVTIKFETHVLTLVQHVPTLCVGRLVREWDKRL